MPYLADLGVSHVYCSPVLEAVPGSAHGYDVVDHSRLSRELGGEDGWRGLVDAARAHGLGIVIDVVPNHMALPTPENLNAAYWDLLRGGPESPYAGWFDVDWDAGEGKLVAPVLGEALDVAIANGDVTIDGDVVRYFDHVFPLAPGTAATGDLLQVLAAQHYRLVDWRVGSTELNYRRFFDVTTLAGLCVDDPEVFDATHARIRRLVDDGHVDGLRIDHPDGLADPGGYLERLRDIAGDRWVVVEKILEPGEWLPKSWSCAGTTGYDALRAVTQVLADPAGASALTAAYVELTDADPDFHAVVDTSKRYVVETLFEPEVRRLTREAVAIAPGLDAGRLRSAIVELLVAHDVYRTYPGDADSMRRLEDTVRHATDRAPDAGREIEWWAQVLRREVAGAEQLAVRFEQTTGPVMAKGVEDTAFYRYLRLVALNEVGGDPGVIGTGVEGWHEFCATLVAHWPATMTTLSTHDTKRSEDVRARQLVLAELPHEWVAAVQRWRTLASRYGELDRPTDYLFWQTLVGTGPISVERMQAYLAKATREAKLETSWLDPDEDYAERVSDFVAAVMSDTDLMSAVADWCGRHVDAPGRSNALAQKLLQLTMPGIPDLYQGQEVTEPTLVDPDNRRPVDYDARRTALADLERAEPKLRVTTTALRLRRELPGSFAAAYTPIAATGVAADHAVAFRRGEDVVAVATRLPVGLQRRGGWGETSFALPPGDWRDAMTGKRADGRLGNLLADLPIALLVRDRG